MQSGDSSLILAAGTLGTFDLLERIDAASAVGFAGLGLRVEDYDFALAQGTSVAELQSRLEDANLRVVEVQHIGHWAEDGDNGERSRSMEDGCFRVADALSPSYVIAGNTALPYGWEASVASFAALCDRALEHGLEVALEFVPWGSVADADAAWRLVSASGSRNAGVLVDTWHHFRGANEMSMIRAIPSERINALQISDALREVEGTLFEDTMNRRRFPGEGDFDLIPFMRFIRQIGVTASWSVEVLAEDVRKMSPMAAAQRAYQSMQALLAEAFH